ncbi:VOC family protein [Rhodobacterales bacterium HKCCE3408]|nr:VOC family protein [Rhodobacterales bacterium HKCCE3408]
MAKVLGIGGVFLKCADPAATRTWYERVLGMKAEDYGGFHFHHAESAAIHGPGAMTIFSGFEARTDYFDPSELPFMLNLMVDDLDAILAHAEAAGVSQVQPREDLEYGCFAWIMDPDGRKLELWQPPA